MAKSLQDFYLSVNSALRSAGAGAAATVPIVLVQTASELMGFGAVPFRAVRLLLLYNNNNITRNNRRK